MEFFLSTTETAEKTPEVHTVMFLHIRPRSTEVFG